MRTMGTILLTVFLVLTLFLVGCVEGLAAETLDAVDIDLSGNSNSNTESDSQSEYISTSAPEVVEEVIIEDSRNEGEAITFSDESDAICGDNMLNLDWEQCDGTTVDLCTQIDATASWTCSVGCTCLKN